MTTLKYKIIAVLIAVVVVFVTRSHWLPVFVRPDHDFLYATGDYTCTHLRYEVEGGRLIESRQSAEDCDSSGRTYYGYDNVRLHVYEVRQDSSREISFREAEQLRLDYGYDVMQNNVSKPSNGFRVLWPTSACGQPNFFCSAMDYDNVWLDGWSTRRKLNIPVSDLGGRFKFLGWIVGT